MGRRGNGGMDDYEMERRMEDMEERRGYRDDEVLYVFIGIGVAIALAIGGLGWLDNHFGWETLDWFKGLLDMK